jgi:hypothetical protein
MAGMTALIARIVHDGNTTLGECAGRLGLTREQLDSRLILMERQGYLTRVKEAAFGVDCSCGHCCAACCRSTGTPAPEIFTLTPKGEHLIRGTGRI